MSNSAMQRALGLQVDVLAEQTGAGTAPVHCWIALVFAVTIDLAAYLTTGVQRGVDIHIRRTRVYRFHQFG